MLTPRQADILLLLYRFRFLTRRHIQSILNHKHLNRIASWLQQLITDGYIVRDANHKVPIYSLASKGRAYLKSKEGLSISRLNQVWRETKYSNTYRDRCILLADFYIELKDRVIKEDQRLHFYTKVELNGRTELVAPPPDAYIALEEKSEINKRYFIEIIVSAPPRVIRQRLEKYVEYFESNEWQEKTNKDFPRVVTLAHNDKVQKQVRSIIQSTKMEGAGVLFSSYKELLALLSR